MLDPVTACHPIHLLYIHMLAKHELTLKQTVFRNSTLCIYMRFHVNTQGNENTSLH